MNNMVKKVVTVLSSAAVGFGAGYAGCVAYFKYVKKKYGTILVPKSKKEEEP